MRRVAQSALDGVSGGVWKSIDAGANWTPLAQLQMANLAVASLAFEPGNTNILYAGTGEGFFNADAIRGAGIFRSTDAGVTWTPVFDDQPVQSIGAVEIDKRNPETVWVGSGEAWTRNSVSIGDGIYKTTDGGDTWQKLGLPGSERIVDIRIDLPEPRLDRHLPDRSS